MAILLRTGIKGTSAIDLARRIIENLKAAVESFEEIMVAINGKEDRKWI